MFYDILTASEQLLIATAPEATTTVAETTVAVETAVETMSKSQVIENSLLLMGQGMGGIFVVMAAISLIVWAVTKFGSRK